MAENYYKLEREILSAVREAGTVVEREFPSGQEALTPEQGQLWNGIRDMVFMLNGKLFEARTLRDCALDAYLANGYVPQDKEKVTEALDQWLTLCKQVIDGRLAAKNELEEQFRSIMDQAKYVSFEVLRERTVQRILAQPAENQKELCEFYQTYAGFWGSLDIANGCYEVVENRLHALIGHQADFFWLYEQLSDYRSRFVLVSFLHYWLCYDRSSIRDMREFAFRDYFDLDLYTPEKEEVFVDLGAYTGDTVEDYLAVFPSYRKFYCFEMSDSNVGELQRKLQGRENIQVIPKAVGAEKGVMKMWIDPGVSSENSIGHQSIDSVEREVEVTTVDDEIPEKVTTIKMDIEGAEQGALLGCRRHILEDHPKLLICVYHNNEDIWKIPRMIHELSPDYKFYLRSNGYQWGPSEIVLFGV